MLIGKGSRRPNREKIRNIKEALGTALNLPKETVVLQQPGSSMNKSPKIPMVASKKLG